jgi:putative phosphoesterase
MEIGIIADIHADFHALRIALDIMGGQGADITLCAGDLVEKGPYGDKVVELLREQAIPCVMGNHDYSARANYTWRLEHPDLAERYHDVSLETLSYLKDLPQTLELSLEGRCLHVAHGTPWSFDTYVFPYSSRQVFKRVAHVANADVVILGHTHEPMVARFRERWIVNPGSVCETYSHGSGTCAVLSLPSCNLKVFDLKHGKRTNVQYVEF